MTFTVAEAERLPEPPVDQSGTTPQVAGMFAAPEPTPQLALVQVETVTEIKVESVAADKELPVPEKVDEALTKVLSWKRPYNSHSEDMFIKWLRAYITDELGVETEIKSTNVVAVIRRTNYTDSDVLFSCHTDTVHSTGGKQSILYDPSFGHIFLDPANKGTNCLGADDGVGVWIMLGMIQSRVPGTYVFHRGEECGGQGSYSMLRENKEWLQKFKMAVAFDRPRTNEVISHQGGMRCASDKFCTALAKALNDVHPTYFSYAPSDRGVFTDTKVYRGVIDECTNLGVGYENQHGNDEFLNYAHALLLREAACRINWEALPIDRDAKKDADMYAGWRGINQGYGRNYFGRGGESWEPGQGSLYGAGYDYQQKRDDKWAEWLRSQPASKGKKQKKLKPAVGVPKPRTGPTLELDVLSDIEGATFDELVAFCETTPNEAAAALIELGAEVVALREKLKFVMGALK